MEKAIKRYQHLNFLRYADYTYNSIINENTQQWSQEIEKLYQPREMFKILQDQPGKTMEYFNFLLSNAPLSLAAHSIQVREIYIGNIPQIFSEIEIKNIMQLWGPMESVEILISSK